MFQEKYSIPIPYILSQPIFDPLAHFEICDYTEKMLIKVPSECLSTTMESQNISVTVSCSRGNNHCQFPCELCIE